MQGLCIKAQIPAFLPTLWLLRQDQHKEPTVSTGIYITTLCCYSWLLANHIENFLRGVKKGITEPDLPPWQWRIERKGSLPETGFSFLFLLYFSCYVWTWHSAFDRPWSPSWWKAESVFSSTAQTHINFFFKQEFWRSIGLGNRPITLLHWLQTHIPGPQTENVVAPFGSVSNGRHNRQQQEGGRRDGSLLQSVFQGHLCPFWERFILC